MDVKAKELAGYLVERIRNIPPQMRLIIGIAGIPASGKSTLAKLIVKHTNVILQTDVESEPAERTEAIVIGLDGWHLTRAQLAALPNPQLAKSRRGAHWTFDPDGYLEFVKNLRLPLSPPRSHADSVAEPIIAPSFDHAVKDPDPTGVKIYPWHRIVVIEGLYCFLSLWILRKRQRGSWLGTSPVASLGPYRKHNGGLGITTCPMADSCSTTHWNPPG